MDYGELLTRSTVRVALLFYVGGLALHVSARGRQRQLEWARLFWTCGCLVFLAHVACAFQFYHHWSHAAAFEATAQRTLEVTGTDWGGGLYVNYAFALIWISDVAWWWCAAKSYRTRPRLVEWSVQSFMAFIAVNATVVFGVGPVRWWGLAVSLCLAAWTAYWLIRSRSAHPQKV